MLFLSLTRYSEHLQFLISLRPPDSVVKPTRHVTRTWRERSTEQTADDDHVRCITAVSLSFLIFLRWLRRKIRYILRRDDALSKPIVFMGLPLTYISSCCRRKILTCIPPMASWPNPGASPACGRVTESDSRTRTRVQRQLMCWVSTYDALRLSVADADAADIIHLHTSDSVRSKSNQLCSTCFG